MNYSIIFTFLGNILAIIAVLFLPGWTILLWIRPRGRDLFEQLPVAAGLSLAVESIFAVLMNASGWRFTPRQWVLVFVSLLFISLLAILVHLARNTLFSRRRKIAELKEQSGVPKVFSVVSGMAPLTLVLAFRLYQIRDLVLPSWIESVNQVFMVTKMVRWGGVPEFLLPELPGIFAPYLAFPFPVSIFALLSSWDPASATLLVGQIIITLLSLSVYRLGKALFNNWKLAVVAALLTGFAFTLPGYFIAWGRYEFLTGMLLLPLAMAEVIEWQVPGKKHPFTLLVLLVAGLFLAGPFAPVLLVLFCGCWYGTEIIRAMKNKKRWRGPWQPAAALVLGWLIASDWLSRIKDSSVLLPSSPSLDAQVALLSVFTSPRDVILYLLAFGGLVWMIRERRLTALIIWTGFIVYFSTVKGLPGNWLGEDFAFSLFLPASFLVAFFISSCAELIRHFLKAWMAHAILILGSLSLCLWGARDTLTIGNPSTVLATTADLEALAWIQASTPETARFFINTKEWLPERYRGVDGGYWIMTLTGRSQMLPPLAYLTAANVYYQRVNLWADVASRLNTCSPVFWKLVDSADFQYLYLTKGRGSLQAEALEDCEGLLKVYEKEGITLFEIIPDILVDEK